VIGINTAIEGAQGRIGFGFAIADFEAKEMLGGYQARGKIAAAMDGLCPRLRFSKGDLGKSYCEISEPPLLEPRTMGTRTKK